MFLFLFCNTATQLTTQLPQTRIQVVRSNKVALLVCKLRVEFLLKTDSGYFKDTGVNKPWQPLGIPFAITPIGVCYFVLLKPILGNRYGPGVNSLRQ